MSFRAAGWRAFLLGVLAAGAIPPLTLAPLLLVAIPGLLRLIGRARSWRVAAMAGLAFGMGYNMAGLYWITEAILVMADQFWWAVPIAVPLLAAVLGLFIALPCALARAVPAGWRRVAVLAGGWVLGDLARQFALTGFPWNLLGSAWEMPGTIGLAFMQPAAWVGAHGLTLGILLVAASPMLGRRGLLAGTALVCVWGAAGYAYLTTAAPLPVSPAGLVAVIVQGNVSETDHRDHGGERAWAERVFDRHLALTRQGMAQAGSRPAVVVWPETASPYALAQDEAARLAVSEASAPALITLAGTERFEQPGVAHNSLVAVAPGGAVAGVYDKSHLVPFGEYFPPYAHFLLGEQGFTPGPGLRDDALARPAGDRPADLLRGDLPRPRCTARRPARPAGQHHQRCLVRRLGRTAPAPRLGPFAHDRGGAADAAGSQHRHFGGDRRSRAFGGQPAP